MNAKFDIAIIGGGQAGYTVALELAKKNLSVIIFENREFGGTCLNRGCIPTKSYIYKAKLFSTFFKYKVSDQVTDNFTAEKINKETYRHINRSRLAIERKLKANNITIVPEKVTFFSETTIKTNNNEYSFKTLILATGSLPAVPQIFQDNKIYSKLLTNENIFNLTSFPKSISIIGAGAIGVEFAFFFSSLNIPVTLIEYADSILPFSDKEISLELKKLLKRKKVKVIEKARIKTVNDNLSLVLEDNKIVGNEQILIAAGRKPNMPYSPLSLQETFKGFIQVNDSFRTSIENIFCIGDANGISLLAHSAEDQAKQLTMFLTEKKLPIKKTTPSVIYTSPSASSAGVLEQDADSSYKISKIIYGLSGKAQAEEATNGWIKLISKNGIIQGCHIFGKNSEELLPLCVFAIENKTPISKLTEIIYAHPTYGELLKEAFNDCTTE